MVGSYVVVLHAKQTCAGDNATSLLPPSLLARSPPSICEKINEWRRRRQHSLDAVLHATDNDQREGDGGPAPAWAGSLAGWRAGITRKGIVAKPPSLLPSLSSTSVCLSFVLWDSLWSERERERAEQNALRKLFCAALTTMSVVKQEEQEEQERAS